VLIVGALQRALGRHCRSSPLHGQRSSLFAHESGMNRKPLFKTGKTRPFDFANRTIRFCQFRRQSGVPPTLNDKASPLANRRVDEG
jgi:hypothetical protein